jgi:hypothetical protein
MASLRRRLTVTSIIELRRFDRYRFDTSVFLGCIMAHVLKTPVKHELPCAMGVDNKDIAACGMEHPIAFKAAPLSFSFCLMPNLLIF